MEEMNVLDPINHNILKDKPFVYLKSYMLERMIKMFPKNVAFMENTQHGYDQYNPNPYHLEGSVWTHTMLVYNSIKEFNSIPIKNILNNYVLAYDDRKQFNFYNIVLLTTALFHDIGKGVTKKEHKNKKYRCTFYSHADHSLSICKALFCDFFRTNNSKEEFDTEKCKDYSYYLISKHMNLYDVNKINKLRDIVKNNYYIAIMMYLFREADKQGQIKSINENGKNNKILDDLFIELFSDSTNLLEIK